jgi:hypothetical protein
MGPTALLSSKGSGVTDFVAFKNPSLTAGFEPANLGSSGKHDNNDTTENDIILLIICL